jgi:hypothetical protein
MKKLPPWLNKSKLGMTKHPDKESAAEDATDTGSESMEAIPMKAKSKKAMANMHKKPAGKAKKDSEMSKKK